MTDKKDGLTFEKADRFTVFDPDAPVMIDPCATGDSDISPEFLEISLKAGEYIHMDAHIAAVKAARLEGYEIARKEAAECGWHLRRADLVEALNV